MTAMLLHASSSATRGRLVGAAPMHPLTPQNTEGARRLNFRACRSSKCSQTRVQQVTQILDNHSQPTTALSLSTSVRQFACTKRMEQSQLPAAPPTTPAPAADDVDMHHRAFFSFEPTLLLADLGNIVSAGERSRQSPAVPLSCAEQAVAASAPLLLSLHLVSSHLHQQTPTGPGLLHLWHPSAGAVRGRRRGAGRAQHSTTQHGGARGRAVSGSQQQLYHI